jgi:class 3 adenylate cyclase
MLADHSFSHGQDVIFNLRRQNIDIPTYSLADLYLCAGDANKSYFARHFSNKIILIGSTLDVEDQILSSARFILPGMERSPVETCTTSTHQNDVPSRLGLPVMPGVYLHAAMVQNLIDNDLIKSMSPQFHAILTLIVIGSLMMASVLWSPVASMSLLGTAHATFAIGSALAFASNVLIFFLVPAVGATIGFGGGLSLRLLILERRRRRVRDAFNHLLPANVVEQLIDRNEIPTAGGKLITCTVLLTDLENYTGLAEQLKPDELVNLLNQVNQVLDDVVERHGGIVSWHAGDSLLALFGAPIECTDHAAQGVRAAIDCCSAVNGLNRPHLLGRNISLRLRVGVSTGKILVGYIGSNRQLTYSAIGDHVNIASRLEGLNKIYGTSVLVNETTRFSAEHDFDWKPIDRTFIKGRKAPVGIFEPTFKQSKHA